jgi:glycerol kinase
MKKYIAALDQGTTSTRFLLFDRQGRPVGSDQMEHRQIFPQPGWVEHDAEEIVEKSLKVAIGAFSQAGIDPQNVAGIGITNQRETVVLWDKTTGRPVHNALVWQDTRTAEFCRRIDEAHGAEVRAKTGLPVTTYFSASKLNWLLENVPNARRRAEAGELLAGTIDSWLIWRLTGGPKGGVHVTDATNASRTLLMDLKTLDWDPWLLDLFGVPRNILPPIRPSSEVYGTTSVLPYDLPVAAALGDQQAALFGQAGFDRGDAKNTYGTGAFLLMNTGKTPIVSANGLLTTVASLLPGEAPDYGLEGSVAMAGATVQWLRDNLGIIASSAEVEPLARSVADNGGVYFVPAFSGLFAPYWRPDARGVVAGLTRFATKAHLARAALESVAYQTRDVVEAMERDAGAKIPALKVDGGMTANALFLQFQADVLGVRVLRPVVTETTALGAAYAAGLALGFWKDRAELKAQWAIEKRWEPLAAPEVRERWYADWKKAVEKSLGWVDSPNGAAP